VRRERPHRLLDGLANRTVAVGHAREAREYARSVADAAEGDARMGGRGIAVSVEITTDPAEAPADCLAADCLTTDLTTGESL